jgi:hypothetical protein
MTGGGNDCQDDGDDNRPFDEDEENAFFLEAAYFLGSLALLIGHEPLGVFLAAEYAIGSLGGHGAFLADRDVTRLATSDRILTGVFFAKFHRHGVYSCTSKW